MNTSPSPRPSDRVPLGPPPATGRHHRSPLDHPRLTATLKRWRRTWKARAVIAGLSLGGLVGGTAAMAAGQTNAGAGASTARTNAQDSAQLASAPAKSTAATKAATSVATTQPSAPISNTSGS